MNLIREKIFFNKLKEAKEYVEPTVADKIQEIIDLLIDENHSNKESRQKFVDLLYQLVELENDSDDRRTSVRKFFKYVSSAISDYEKDIEDDSDMLKEKDEKWERLLAEHPEPMLNMAQAALEERKKENKNISKKELLEKINKLKGKIENFLCEGEKLFYQTDNIGTSKYTISYHDGKSKNPDGSDFYGIKIFKNKRDLNDFTTDLLRQGYKYKTPKWENSSRVI